MCLSDEDEIELRDDLDEEPFQFDTSSPIDGWIEGEEPGLRFWTDFDWDMFCLIQEEDYALWMALPENVRKKGESMLADLYTP